MIGFLEKTTLDLARPYALVLMLLVVPVVLLGKWGSARKIADLKRLGQSGAFRKDRLILPVMILAILILAIAGPRWGRISNESTPGHEIILLMDVSRSMAAEDAVPNRLGSAALAAESLVKSLAAEPGERIGVVAFAGKGELRCPLTDNLGAVLETLQSLKPGEMQSGGTNLGDGLREALNAFDPDEAGGGRTIVVFTDGEDHAGSWPSMLERLRAARVQVHGITIGDSEAGHPVPIGNGSKTQALTSHGQEVKTKRDDSALDSIRSATGGVLIAAARARIDLGKLYREQIATTARIRRERLFPPQRQDHYALFVILALAVLTVDFWRPRMRNFTLFVVVGLGLGADSPVGSFANMMTQGMSAYRANDYANALKYYDQAIASNPESAISRYNRAAALYQLQRVEEAESAYRDAKQGASAALRVKIDYALGNTAVVQGKYSEALAHFDACLSSTLRDSAVKQIQVDAAANRKYAVSLLPPPLSEDPEGKQKKPGPQERDQPKADRLAPEKKSSGTPEANSKSSGSSRPSPSAKTGESDADAGSPNESLDAMLSNVRKVQSRNTDQAPSRPSESRDDKDW